MPTKSPGLATITAYKGFDANWQCRGFQFRVGGTYEHAGPVKLCESGFHACETPLDCLNYYSAIDGNFAEVELSGVSDEREKDTKRVGSSIKIKAALSIAGLISAQIEWCKNFADKKSIAEGNYSTAASSGHYSTAACDTNGFACVAGLRGRVKGNARSALSLGYRDAKGRNRFAVAYVGEDGIKPDTWYRVDGTGTFMDA